MKIILKNITQTFPSNVKKNFDAISNVSFEINQGEFIGIIGPTGAGKTTLIEHLNALLVPTKGEIEFQYQWTTKNKKTSESKVEDKVKVVKKSWKRIKNINHLRKSIGIVFQFAEYQLFEETIEKDIIFGPINIGIPKEEAKEIAKEIIEKVGLTQDYLQKSPFELSGGQKRRVALAGILAMKPDVLVFDEPTAGLDPKGEQEMMQTILNAKKSGQTVVVITHTMDHVLQIADKVMVLKKGEIFLQGKPYEVFTNKQLLKETKMELPKVIEFIDKLASKNRKFEKLYKMQPRTVEELADCIQKVLKG